MSRYKIYPNSCISVNFSNETDTHQSLSKVNTFYNVNLNNIIAKIGNDLTFDANNHCVIVGKDVNHVKISGLAHFSTPKSSTVQIQICVNGVVKNKIVISDEHGGQYFGVTLAPCLVDVKENDKITLQANSSALPCNVVRALKAIYYNYLTVEVVD